MWCYHAVGITLISACINTTAELFEAQQLTAVSWNWGECQERVRETFSIHQTFLQSCASKLAGLQEGCHVETEIHPSFLRCFPEPWGLGRRAKPQFHFFFCWYTRVSPTSLLPKHFSETKRERHQFERKLVLSLFFHKTENGRSSWSMHVNMCMSHPPPTLWWN